MQNASNHTRHRLELSSRDDFAKAALLVEQDFRRLADTLRWMVRTAEKSDEELIERIVRTKSVAERGLRLSRLLSVVSRKPRA